MKNETLQSAIDILAEQFIKYDWTYHDVTRGNYKEKTLKWLGPEDEDIIVCIHKGYGIHEKFHRHDFFFFNFAYRGDYDALSYEYDNLITIREGELYVGQPFTGYALVGNDEEEIIIVGVLIQKETFFKSFLPVISGNEKLLHFFIDPAANELSNEFIHLHPGNDSVIHSLLETMIVEYAYKKDDTQAILKPLTLALIMYTARQYALEHPKKMENRTINDIVQYISENVERVSLKEVAERFSYHPNYLSSLLQKELGNTFSQIVLQQRMERALILLKNTNLTVEEIASMVGYGDNSNFYKAFRGYFHTSPREQIKKEAVELPIK